MSNGTGTAGRWSALVIACLVLAGAAGVRASTHEAVRALRDDHRVTAVSDHLIVNLDATLRYVTPRKCQADGEMELTALSAVSKLEESYIFVPSICLWIESGYNETERSVSLDESLLYAIVRQYSEVAIYHIQPGHRPSVANYFPSYRDFISMVLINTRFLGEPAVDIRHRAVTEFAIIDYRFSNWSSVQDRARAYERKGLGRFISQNLAYEFNRQKYLSDYLLQIEACADRIEDQPAQIGVVSHRVV